MFHDAQNEKPTSGYLTEWIDVSEQELEKQEFLCPICHLVFREPVHTDNGSGGDDEPCGHLFCEVCIRRWLETNSTCPQCRKHLSKEQLRADMNLRRKIRNLPARCHIDSKRCPAKSTIGRDGAWWKEHDQVCEYKVLECPACHKVKYERKALFDHLESACYASPIGCRLQCGTLLLRKDRKKHEEKCIYRLVDCKQCGARGIRGDKLKRHQDKECEEAPIPCEYQSLGCTTTFLRKDKESRQKHMTLDTSFHMSLMLQEIRYLRAKLEGKNTIVSKDSINDDQEPNEITLLWSIKWVLPKNEIESETLFTAFGAEWGMSYGDPEADDNSVPIFVTCSARGPTVRCALAILHPITGDLIKEKTNDRILFSSDEAFGWRELITLTELEAANAFNRSKGLARLLFRAKISRVP